MKKLLIVESPAKIKTIKKFLGKDFLIMSTIGHIKDLPKKGIGITMNDHIKIDYVTIDDKQKVIDDLTSAAARSDEVFLAPDPDREGEIIAWHVEQEIEKTLKKTKSKKSPKIHRITFNEITKPALEEAIAHPHTIDLNKVSAQQARRVLDRWVGYEVSPVLWKKISAGLSAGRVQSVALKLICTREDEIRAFKPEEYWTITATFGFDADQLIAPLTHIKDSKGKEHKADIKNEAQAKKTLQEIKEHDYAVESIKDSKRSKNPNAPFMTSTLQQAAYNRLGFNVQKTMQLAQKLYEGVPLQDKDTPVALITYMRTDSLRISDVAIKQVRNFIGTEYGDAYLPEKQNVYAKKAGKIQDAHEAVRPIDITLTPEKVAPFLESSLLKLYTLIWQRFVACQMTPAQYAQRQVTIAGGPFIFKVTGSTLLFDGFMKLYAEQETESTEAAETEKEGKVSIPKNLKENSVLALKKLDPKQHFTQPPARYTEASLVKQMEKEGIGRPSTYATIMKTIQARAYTQLDDRKRFIPTELGMAVVKLLDENLPKIMNISFTALMEEDLDKIAQGEVNRDDLLHAFYKDFSKDLKKFAGEKTERPAEPTDITCLDCKKQKLTIKFGKAGAFLGCPGYPECTFTSNFERLEDGTINMIKKKEPELLDEECPQCAQKLMSRIGRYGPFTSCSGYPACKYIKQEQSSFMCPECGTAKMNKRSWKGKVFWGCSQYPNCRFSIPGDIEEHACKKCKRPYMLKRVSKDGNITLVCHNKECPSNKKKK